jgi:hypothetical protein
MAWYEQASGSLSSSIRPSVICPIFGSNFGPKTLDTSVLSSGENKVRVLNIPILIGYVYPDDAESFEVLYRKEANTTEVNLFKTDRGASILGFIQRVTTEVRLQSSVVHAFPDHKLFEVLVILHSSSSIGPDDYGFLIPRRELNLTPATRAKRSFAERMAR